MSNPFTYENAHQAVPTSITEAWEMVFSMRGLSTAVSHYLADKMDHTDTTDAERRRMQDAYNALNRLWHEARNTNNALDDIMQGEAQ